ncbi:MAG: hypothetical protein HY231_23610 [Acidobacteria bacterium]|nr:hypothetical protein [Acidobacteriota bacterium]
MATTSYQIITAKYKGNCAVCGNTIKPGEKIQYAKGEPVIHAGCEMPEIPANAIHISGGSGYGYEDWRPGEVIVNPNRSRRPEIRCPQCRLKVFRGICSNCGTPGEAVDPGAEFLYVLTASQQYYREDGMSFNVGDEQGYVYYATCRPATDEESAPLRARIAEQQKLREAEVRRKAFAKQISETGIFPEQADPQGDRITDRQNIYGGGDWFVLGEDRIWYVRNNGHDGDDWSRNNIGTGGAGALGWYVERTDALANELLTIEQALDPKNAEKREQRRANAMTGLVYQKHFEGRIDAILWGVPASAPSVPPRLAFVTLSPAKQEEVPAPAILAGADADGVWLAMHYANANEDYDVYGFLAGQYAFAVRYDPTPERLAEIENRLPDWCPPQLIQTYYDAQEAARAAKKRFDVRQWHIANPKPVWRDEFTQEQRREWSVANKANEEASMQNFRQGEAAAKEATEAVWAQYEAIKPGRYRMPGSWSSEGWAADNRSALEHCIREGISLSAVTVTDATLIHKHGQTWYQGKKNPWQLWSDGRATTGSCYGGEGVSQLSAVAAELIGVAIRQSFWQQDGRWKNLLGVEQVEAKELDKSKDGGRGSGEERVLERLTLRGGEVSTLYRATVNWWCMGEDGDAGTDITLFETESEARAEFQKR